MKNAIIFSLCNLAISPVFAANTPTVTELRKLFPRYANLRISTDKAEEFRAHPCKQGKCTVAAAAGVEDVIIKGGKATLSKDIDGDGKPDYVFVGKWDGKQKMCEQSDGAFMLGVLKKSAGGWKVLHERQSGENCVLSAFLVSTSKGFETDILEGRSQCDDAKLEKYEIVWDESKKALSVPVKGSELHPFTRKWDCGD